MKFRPCIDIHNGKVKQIVGSSLRDEDNVSTDNFVSEMDASYYAKLYRDDKLDGGHIILLNPPGSEYYEADCRQAFSALAAFPGGMQIGGGINADNAAAFLEAGASHVIVTSFVFKDGHLNMKNLQSLINSVGKEHIVLDLSCRRKGNNYFIVTDRWQKFTDIVVNQEMLNKLSVYCSEFLVHAVDVEGKSAGIDEELAAILGACKNIPITYAGGVRSMEDFDKLRIAGKERLDVTVGSALNLFGGPLDYKKVVKYMLTNLEIGCKM